MWVCGACAGQTTAGPGVTEGATEGGAQPAEEGASAKDGHACALCSNKFASTAQLKVRTPSNLLKWPHALFSVCPVFSRFESHQTCMFSRFESRQTCSNDPVLSFSFVLYFQGSNLVKPALMTLCSLFRFPVVSRFESYQICSNDPVLSFSFVLCSQSHGSNLITSTLNDPILSFLFVLCSQGSNLVTSTLNDPILSFSFVLCSQGSNLVTSTLMTPYSLLCLSCVFDLCEKSCKSIITS